MYKMENLYSKRPTGLFLPFISNDLHSLFTTYLPEHSVLCNIAYRRRGAFGGEWGNAAFYHVNS